ncbi:programmed cell death protein 6-like [Euwallacea similis]|uniref:programmed cell death protein 6-like n=1 Tax=Euwallacea similis TaxID=1736056 RepID=UPI0034500130
MSLINETFLYNIFQSIDQDKSGYIDASELQKALLNGSWEPFDIETVKMMIAMFDRGNSGKIGFSDFEALWKYVDDWQKCFSSFDMDHSGTIDKNEFRSALFTFGYKLSDSVIDQLITKFNENGEGTILFDKFIWVCVKLHALTAAFNEYDTDKDGYINIPYDQFLNLIISL